MPNPIPESDFRARLSKVRQAMRRRNLQALLVYSQKRSHVTYLSGYRPNYHTNSAFVLVPLEGEPILWIKFPFDLPRARAMSWFADIRPSVSEEQEKMVAQVAESVRSLGLGSSAIGLVGSDLAVDEISVTLSQQISTHLPNAQVTPASDLLNEIRLVKSAAEIAQVREAARLADVVAEELRKTIRPGMKDHDAVVRATQAARIEGGEDCTIILSTHPSRMALPPCGYEFQMGHTVACEISVNFQGYWVQVCRVLSMGRPTAAQKAIFEATRDAHEAAVQAAKPGVPVAVLLVAAHKVIAEAGYMDYVQYGPGHGIGLDLPELYPLDLHCTSPLAAGVIMIIHPAIWVPDQGAAFVGGPIAVSDGEPLRLDTPQREILEA